MKKYIYILIPLTIILLTILTYAVRYTCDRAYKIAEAQKCGDMLTNPPRPEMMPSPDGTLAPVYSINTYSAVVVPPSLWNMLRGRIVFENVPKRMKVNPYSFTDVLLGRYTFGPTDVACDQSATTTLCSQFDATSTPQIDRKR
jgi:hypothetical protein